MQIHTNGQYKKRANIWKLRNWPRAESVITERGQRLIEPRKQPSRNGTRRIVIRHASMAGCICDDLRDVLVKGTSVAMMASETLPAVKAHTGLSCLDITGITSKRQPFGKFVKLCYVTFSQRARSLVLTSDICKSLVNVMLYFRQADVMGGDLCHPLLLRVMEATYTHFLLHSLSYRLARESSARG